MHCAQTAEDIHKMSFAGTTVSCLSQIMLKFGLHRSTLSLQILPQTDPTLLT